MGGRVVEGTGLENQQGGNSFVGSNPTPSAMEEYIYESLFLGMSTGTSKIGNVSRETFYNHK